MDQVQYKMASVLQFELQEIIGENHFVQVGNLFGLDDTIASYHVSIRSSQHNLIEVAISVEIMETTLQHHITRTRVQLMPRKSVNLMQKEEFNLLLETMKVAKPIIDNFSQYAIEK